MIPPCSDALTLRKSIQDALGHSFGIVYSNTYVDVLWVAEDGSEMVIRIAERYAFFFASTFKACLTPVYNYRSEAAKLLASVTAYQGSPRLSLVKESPFLPSLLSTRSTV